MAKHFLFVFKSLAIGVACDFVGGVVVLGDCLGGSERVVDLVVGGVVSSVCSGFVDTSFEPFFPDFGASVHVRPQPRPATTVTVIVTAVSAFAEMHVDTGTILTLEVAAMLG